MHHIS
jgi:hypothetical protein